MDDAGAEWGGPGRGEAYVLHAVGGNEGSVRGGELQPAGLVQMHGRWDTTAVGERDLVGSARSGAAASVADATARDEQSAHSCPDQALRAFYTASVAGGAQLGNASGRLRRSPVPTGMPKDLIIV